MKSVIYFDMDGCIADIKTGYDAAFNRDINKDDSFTVGQFCRQEPHFFRMLPVLEKGKELFDLLKDDYKIVFLTTPMHGMPFCKRDKIEWIRENIGNYDVIFSDNKAEYVLDDQSILIDDMDYNLQPWTESGGTAIKFPGKIDKIIEKIENTFNPPEESKIKQQLKNIIVNTNPSKKQKETGNYKKSEIINFKGLKIRIENPKGSIRTGFSSKGRKWVNRMKHHYGYIIGTEGADADEIDVFIGPELNKSLAFVVNQGFDGKFDEHKIFLGFESAEDVEKAYLSNYEKGWPGLMDIVQTNTKKIRSWIESVDKIGPFK
jgi:5'(3')-deoxyribonucleotidase